MSGRGRKQPNRNGARRSQPTPKAGAGASRAKAGPTPSRQGSTGRGGAAARSDQTQPVTGPPRRPPVPGSSRPASNRPSNRNSRDARRARDARRRRNQRLGVLIGALALAAALIGSRLAFQGTPSSAAQNAAGTSAAPSASPAAAPTTAAASSSTTAVPAMAITCPTGGGATTLFGHDISVAEPYTVTITYGDGDKYTNDSAHLGAIFSHTYKKAGTYQVKADLTGSAGETASAGCVYTWGP